MKKVLWLGILFSLLFIHQTFAAYTFSASAKASTISATLSGVPTTNKDTFRIEVLTTDFPAGEAPSSPPNPAALFNPTDADKKVGSNGSISWVLTKWNTTNYFKPSTTYYVRIVELLPKYPYYSYATPATTTVKTGAETISLLPLNTKKDGDYIIVSGQVDLSKTSSFDPSKFTAQLTYSPNPTFGSNTWGPIPTTGSVNADGTYSWSIPVSSLSPSTPYFLSQRVTDGASGVYVNDPVAGQAAAHFNSDDATIVVPGTASELTYDQQHGYTLLSPFPNLSFLPDPQLCAQEIAQGKRPQICDLNDLINYILKLMIGLTAVFLVIRLMIDGYNIMVTDIPKMKANAKGSFLQSLAGLLLVLSSYLILNTINPKLVDGSLDINQLAISLPGGDGLGLDGTGSASSDTDTNWAKTNGRKTTVSLKTGGAVTVTPCDSTQMQTVTAFGHTFQVQKNLVASIQRINAKWQQMSPQYPIGTVGGYNCRTIAKSNKLSFHAYGLAVDVNEATNGVNTKGNMPAAFIKLWTDEGWGWGGNWSSYKDPMHFSKGNGNSGVAGTGEQGDLKGE